VRMLSLNLVALTSGKLRFPFASCFPVSFDIRSLPTDLARLGRTAAGKEFLLFVVFLLRRNCFVPAPPAVLMRDGKGHIAQVAACHRIFLSLL